MSVFPAHAHVFVDESKAKGYYVAAAAVAASDVRNVDRDLRGLVRPGQTRIHFKSESDSSRRLLLARMSELPVQVKLYVVRGRPHKEARTMCLEALVADLAECRADRLVLERDASVEQADRRMIRAALKANRYEGDLRYEHAAPKEHAALWVSDAVAWAHQSGGDWRRRAASLVVDIALLG